MVGNWPHSILTLPRTAVTKVLILPLAKVSQIALVYIQILMDFFLPHTCRQCFIQFGQFLNNCEQFPLCLAPRRVSYQMLVKDSRQKKKRQQRWWLWNGWWRGGWLGWQEGRYMRFHHWRPVRKTPILIRSHLSFFERCEKNNVGFPTTILIKASLENNVEMLRV